VPAVNILKYLVIPVLVGIGVPAAIAQTPNTAAPSAQKQKTPSPPAATPAVAPPAASAVIEGLPVSIGDTSDKVREVYQTKLEPEPNETSLMKGTTALRLKTKGVWFFFTREGKIYTIRLEAPFPGTIGGVKIGDTASKMLKVLGNPAKVPKPIGGLNANLPRSYIYYLDDVTTANFQVNSDDEVEIVFLVK
jgi:hypothetical protein